MRPMLPQDQSVQRAPEPFVQLHALGVTYSGGVQALRCIDLDFRAGTFVALLGLHRPGIPLDTHLGTIP